MPRIYQPNKHVYSPPELAFLSKLHELDDSWMVFVSVWFWDEPKGEIDFLLYHREHGIIVVEVKGGSLSCVNGKWAVAKKLSLTGKVGFEPAPSPIEQVLRSFHWVRDTIKNITNKARPLVTWVVAFPTVSYEDSRIDDGLVQAGGILFKEHGFIGKSLLEILDSSQNQYRHHPFTEEQEAQFIRSLLPGANLYESTENHLQANVNVIEAQCEPLRELAATLRYQKRAQVVGPPGSGKTTLGLAWLRLQSGLRGFLCFNKALSEWVRAQDSSDEAVEIRTFHDLGRVLIESVFPDAWPVKADRVFLGQKVFAFVPSCHY